MFLNLTVKFILLCGAFYVLLIGKVMAQEFKYQKKIISFERNEMDLFGYAVDIKGNYAVIGAYGEDLDSIGSDSLKDAGAVYVYKKAPSGIWNFSQKLVAPDRSSGSLFGRSLALSSKYIVVGSVSNKTDEFNQNPIDRSGACYVFKLQNEEWIFEKKLVASDRTKGDAFGTSVDVVNDLIIVGADLKRSDSSSGNLSRAGSAYIYEKTVHGNWFESAKLMASSINEYDGFGSSVAANGEFVLITALGEDEDENEMNTLKNSGSAYFFKKDSTQTWSQTQKIVAGDRQNHDIFGYSVDMSEKFAVISALYESEDENGANTIDSTGSVYIFELKPNGNWKQVQKIVSSDRTTHDQFGYDISIDDTIIVVSARLESEDSIGLNAVDKAGSIYVFQQFGSTWIQTQKIVAFDRQPSRTFGISVAIDSTNIIVGSGDDKDLNQQNPVDLAGAAYIISNEKIIGIKNYSQNVILNCYPNPTSNYVTVSIKNVILSEVNLKVYTISGQVVDQKSYLHQNNIQIEMPNTPGVYLLHLTGESFSELVRVIKK